EVDVDRAVVDAISIVVADRGRVRASQRQVTRRVLVEQRVEEHPAGLADATFAVDERDLAEPIAVLVALDPRAQGAGALVGVDLDGPPSLEPDAQTGDDGAGDVER